MSENKRLFLNTCLASWKFTWGGVPFLALFILGRCYFLNLLGQIKYFSSCYGFFEVSSMVPLMPILAWEWVFGHMDKGAAYWSWPGLYEGLTAANGMCCAMGLSSVATDLGCDSPRDQAQKLYLRSYLSSCTLRKSIEVLISSLIHLWMDALCPSGRTALRKFWHYPFTL